jgi:hypothetical protein
MPDVVDVARVDITPATNAARHLFVATFLMGWLWFILLSAVLVASIGTIVEPFSAISNTEGALIAIGCFGFALNLYPRRLHKRGYLALMFDIGLLCAFFGLVMAFFRVGLVQLIPLLFWGILLLSYSLFALVLALRVFSDQYAALRTTPLDLTNRMMRYARRHRSLVPLLHRPNRRVATILCGILFIVCLVLAYAGLSAVGTINNPIFGFLYPWIVVALLIYVAALLRRYYTLPADQVLALDARQPVVYLRSFAADRVRLWGKGAIGKLRRKSIDEAIAPLAATIGPFVAIANPDSRLPQLGAAKTYYTNDTWQSAIGRWVTMAQMIAMVAGRTEGIRWEIGHIFENSAHTKLVVMIPSQMRRDPLLIQEWVLQNFGTTPYVPALGKLDFRHTIALIFRESDIVAIETRRARRSVVDYWTAFQVAIFVSIVAKREPTISVQHN